MSSNCNSSSSSSFYSAAQSLLTNTHYLTTAANSHNSRLNSFEQLFIHRQLPLNGYDSLNIQLLLNQLSALDSNNSLTNLGVGEREGRVYSKLVSTRHYELSHGIGRSGDLIGEQPKAAGSTLILKLTQLLTIHSLELAGLSTINNCLLLPLATGMALTMSLLALKQRFIDSNTVIPEYVIWPRIDQKTCLKCILTAGLKPLIIENELEGDELHTNMNSIESTVSQYGANNILCILSTSSCFAPRGADKLIEISKYCLTNNIPHIINNAYGIQSRSVSELINRASRVGRIDAAISSLDKNYLVPVGGSIVYNFKSPIINNNNNKSSNNTSTINNDNNDSKSTPTIDLCTVISSMYPGRASMSSILDLFITLLELGQNGWIKLLNERERLFPIFQSKLELFAKSINERLLIIPNNQISLAITLNSELFNINSINNSQDGTSINNSINNCSYLGSMLFSRNVSGPKVINNSLNKFTTVGNIKFQHYGSHSNHYPNNYLTVACAIGIEATEIDEFINRLEKTIKQFSKQKLKKQIISNTNSITTAALGPAVEEDSKTVTEAEV